ncbi:MAG: hypothetical protein IJ633_01955 [Prevotella sp.]|nr:hypothetical protein [Prevotella sp.]
MAKIVWNELAASQLEAHLDYAVEEFGQKCVRNWYRDILKIESRLTLQPLSYSPVPALEHQTKEYRGATIMKSFQLIHYYASEIDTVYIDAIWDMRMNPVKLDQLVK